MIRFLLILTFSQMAIFVSLVVLLGFVKAVTSDSQPGTGGLQLGTADGVSGYQLTCFATPPSTAPKPRRYDIMDMGNEWLFHGWVDVQGQGAANDYCRIVGDKGNFYLACALAGTEGQKDINYKSNMTRFDVGYTSTWYMRDEDGDGRDDYCRCVGTSSANMGVVCTKAGPEGFYGSIEQGGNDFTFSPTGLLACKNRIVRPEFGRIYSTQTTQQN